MRNNQTDRLKSYALVAVQFACLIAIAFTGPVIARNPITLLTSRLRRIAFGLRERNDILGAAASLYAAAEEPAIGAVVSDSGYAHIRSVFISVPHAMRLAHAADVEPWIIPNANHARTYIGAPGQCARRVGEFFAQHLF